MKQRIIEQSAIMFRKHGVKAVTMDDIARELGISKRTLYELFSNKEELLVASINHSQQCDRLTYELQSTDQPKNIIDLLFYFYIYVVEQHNEFNRNYFRDIKKHHPKVFVYITNIQKEKELQTGRLLQEGVDAGLIRPDINLQITSRLFKSQFNAYWFSDDLIGDNIAHHEVLATIVLNFTRGISTSKGLEQLDKLIDKARNK